MTNDRPGRTSRICHRKGSCPGSRVVPHEPAANGPSSWNWAGGSSQELFDVADVHKLRIYVRVPQNYSAAIQPGMTAQLSVPEYPGRKFEATLVGSSGAVNDQSGTVLVQLQADNGAGALKPGDYAQVTFSLAPQQGVTTVPASALTPRRVPVFARTAPGAVFGSASPRSASVPS